MLSLVVWIDVAFCQISFIDEITTLPPELNKFVLSGYEPLDTAFADLNLDGRTDAIVVLKVIAEEEKPEGSRRPILILIGQKDQSYKLVYRNDNILMFFAQSPLVNIEATKGHFTIEESDWGGINHWLETTTFTYDKERRDWHLHRVHYLSMKHNPDTKPNAEALIKDIEYTRTPKDFGLIRFVDYDRTKE